MNQGQIRQIGSVDDVYLNPQNLFVAAFLGNPGMNLLAAKLIQENSRTLIQVADATFAPESIGICSGNRNFCASRDKLLVGIRPESIALKENGKPRIKLKARVLDLEHLGSETQVLLKNQAGEFRARVPGRTPLVAGDHILTYISLSDIRLFDGSSQQAIAPVSG